MKLKNGISLRRQYVDEFYSRQIPALPAGCRVLDLGGNKLQKRGTFDITHLDLQVTVCDLVPVKRPDVQADGGRLPFVSQSFEAVICSELLEHVPDPRRVLAECARVLKPGGQIFICTPFLYPIHADPYDFGRYTDHYWRSVLTEAGFNVQILERQGTYYSVMADFACFYLAEVGLRGPLGWLAIWGARRFRVWAARQDQQAPRGAGATFVTRYTTGFGLVAQKS